MAKQSVILLLSLLFFGQFMMLATAQEPQRCDLDKGDIETVEACANAPLIVNLREDAVYNTKMDEKIDAFVLSQARIVAHWWTLDNSKHSESENRTFFEKVERILDFDLKVPKEKLEGKTYTLILYALNDQRQLSFKKFEANFKDPKIWVTMDVSPKGEVQMLKDEVVFKFTKTGTESIFFALSYVRGDRLITIDSRAVEGTDMKDIKYHFPIMKGADNVELVFDYYTLDQVRHTFHHNVTVKNPGLSQNDVEKILGQIEDKTGDPDMKYTLTVVTSLITLDFAEDYHYTEHDFLKCDNNYCNKNGRCETISSGWKKCTCNGGYEGPTCGFQSGKEDQAIQIMKRAVKLLKRANLNDDSIGHYTELIKVIANPIHIYSPDLIESLEEVISRGINNLGPAVTYKNIVEDLFIAVENMGVAIMKDYAIRAASQGEEDQGQKTRAHAKVKSLRDKFNDLFEGILKKITAHEFFNHPMEKCGMTLVKTTPSKMKAETENVILQSEMGRRNQLRVETIVKLPRELLKKKVEGDSVGVILYQSLYNPYQILTGTTLVPVSQVVSVRFKNPSNNKDYDWIDEDQNMALVLKADDHLVRNMKDIDCAKYNTTFSTWDTKVCKGIMHNDFSVECYCDGPGDYALVGKKEKVKTRDDPSNYEVTVCDVDKNELTTNVKCKDAPVIVNLREDTTMNTKMEEKIDAFVVSQSTIRFFFWELDQTKHTASQNETFFKNVKPTGDYDLLATPGSVPAGEYNLILYVVNARRQKSKKAFLVKFAEPTNWIEMKLSTKECNSLNDEVTISFNKTGKDAIFYGVSFVRGDKLVSIETGTATEKINDVKVHFPIFHQNEKQVTIVFDYYLEGQDRQTITDEIKVKRPSMTESDLRNKLSQILNSSPENIDLKWTLAIVTSLITMDFKEDLHHTEHDFVACNNAYCNDHGTCSISNVSWWKGCACTGGFTGPTCAFANSGTENNAIEVLKNTMSILDKVKLTNVNIGQATEIIKVVAGTMHVFSWDVVDGLTKNIEKAVNNLGEAASYRDVFEDIFMAIENIDLALTKWYWNNETPENQNKVYEKIVELREKFNPIFNGILRSIPKHQFFNHAMEKCGTTLVITTPAKVTRDVENVLVQSELGKRNQVKVDTIVGFPKNTLMQYQDGHQSIGIIVFQSFYSPYTSITGDLYMPVSHSVAVKLRNPDNGEDITDLDNEDIYLLLKADRQKVVNMFDVHCAKFHPETQVYNFQGCSTNVMEDNNVQCTCSGPGEYVLVVENDNPQREKEDADNMVRCILDDAETQNRTECEEAPQIVNLREDKVYNTMLDEKIDAFIITQSALRSFWWTLDPDFHADEDNATFFETVYPTGDYDLMIPKGEVPKGEWRLLLFAINAKRIMSIKQFNIVLNDPSVWIEMEAPKEATAMTDLVTFKFKKTGIDDITFLLSYFRNNHMVTIDSNYARNVTEFEVKYRFPVFHTDPKKVDIAFEYFSTTRHAFNTTIMVKRPANYQVSDLEKIITELEKQKDDQVDLQYLLATVTSLISMDFTHDNHHTEHNFLSCDTKYCSSNGDCDIRQDSGWKTCKCKAGFEGATCAFAKDKEKETLSILKRANDLLFRANLTIFNIGHATEIIKVMSSTYHIINVEYHDDVLKNINRIISNLGEAVRAPEVLEDIFLAYENLKVALNRDFWAITSPTLSDEGKTYVKLQELNRAMDGLYNNIFDKLPTHNFMRIPMEKCGFTMVTTGGKWIDESKGFEEVYLQADMGRQNQYRVDTIVYFSDAFYKLYKDGKSDFGIILYQSYYPPYTIFAGDEWVPVSHSVSVIARDLTTKKNLELAGEREGSINVHLKADRDQVSNLKDLECARFDPKTKLFNVSECVATLHDDYGVDCACGKTGEYVLVIKNPQPLRKKESTADPTRPIDPSGGQWTAIGIILGMVLVSGVWGATYVAGLREGLPNPPYNEIMTIHPLYSILKVYSGDTARSVRVHLFFITVASQLLGAVYWYDKTTEVTWKLAAFAIATSIPVNYIFGLIAKTVAGGFKQLSKGYFIIIADIVILVAVIVANLQLSNIDKLNPAHVKEVVNMFIAAILVDVVVLDTIVAQLGNVAPLRNFLALRGFYSPQGSGMGDVTQYLRQPEVAL